MKSLLFSLLISLIILPAFSQELKEMRLVGKAKKLGDGEMVARKDLNGNYCAAIQVISDMTSFSYDSNDGLVDSVDSKPGKDMVFLTASERVLEIFKSGYKPLKVILSDEGIILKSREIWQITVAGDKAVDELPTTFRVTPEDAKLFIDGNAAEASPTQKLTVGIHQIKIELNGYQSIEKTIEVNNKQVFFEWEMKITPEAGLQINTSPEGATIYLDGVKLGESPISEFYSPGTYQLKITKEGCVPIENETIIVSLPQTQKNYILEENVGYLTINTHEGAIVYFNGKKVNNPKKVKLAPQLVKVKVTMSKAKDIEEQVVLKKNDDKVLELYPDIQTGTIQVSITPFDAKIELFGDAGEYYTSNGMKIFENVPIGEYLLKATTEDFIKFEETIILNAENKLTKNIKLIKKPILSDNEILYKSNLTHKNSNRKLKTGHIDFPALIQSMPGQDSINKAYETYAKGLETQMSTMQAQLENKQAEYEANQATMSSILKSTKERELQDLYNRLLEFQQQAQGDLGNYENELLNPLIEKARKAVNDVANENDFSYILNTAQGMVLYSGSGNDIMDLVKRKLGMQFYGDKRMSVAPVTIGHIDFPALIQSMPGQDSINKAYETYAKGLENQMTAMQAELENKQAEYEANQATMSAIIKSTKEKELQDLYNRLLEFQQQAQDGLSKYENELLNPLIEKARNAITTIAEENGFSYILNTAQGMVLYSGSSNDIMDLVKVKLGIQFYGDKRISVVPVSIGHIDFPTLIQSVPGQDSITEAYEIFAKGLENQITTMQAELENKQAEYEANQATMSAIIKSTKERELQDLYNRLLEFQQQAQGDLGNYENQLLNPLIEKARKAVNEVAKEKGFSYILNTAQGMVLFSENGEDIMPFVKAKLGI